MGQKKNIAGATPGRWCVKVLVYMLVSNTLFLVAESAPKETVIFLVAAKIKK
jgi:hypothetical protein